MKKRILIGLGIIVVYCLVLFALGALCFQLEMGIICVIAGITIGNWLYDLEEFIYKKLDKTKEQEEEE